MKRRSVSLLLLGLLVTSAACIPPEPDDDLIVDYDPAETVMGEIQERGELMIGVPKGRPPFDDFTAALGSLVADALGVEAAVVPLAFTEMVTAPAEGVVDISFPLVTITEKLARRYTVTDPFYIAHQRVLAPAVSLGGVDDPRLSGGVVCQIIDPDTGANVKELNPEIIVLPTVDIRQCHELGDDEVVAVTASDWLTFPELVKDPNLEIVGDDLTTEAYGAVIESGASAWLDFVNGVLVEADAEGDWQRFYDAAFGPLADRANLDEPVTAPEMTVEEAAALFPSGL